jgi:hypothetical protein
MRATACRIFMFCILSANLYAQKSSRVKMLYKTETEFSNANPSFDFECKSKDRIFLNDFFIKNYVTVRKGDSIYKFSKSNLYGYQTCNGKVYRFLNRKELLLMNNNEDILIYRHQVAKQTSGRTNVTNYYFSIGKKGKILKLTFKNLKEIFADNTVFLSFLESEFKYNTDLAGYDEELKKYKINVFLDKSKEK